MAKKEHSKRKGELDDIVNEQRAAIYIRVSTRWQIDKDSLPLQRSDLPKYAEIALGIKSYVIFEDAGYSAKNTDRPAYQQMMARLRVGEFSHLLVWKIDRISRNLLDFAAMYQELKDYGVTFVSKNEQFDTSTAIGEAMLKIILVFAELERNMTSERVTAVMLSRAEQGMWNGGPVPYGYDYDRETKEFSINESEASVVRTIYEMYRQGSSSTVIVKYLNGRGLQKETGSGWSQKGVCDILRNPFYCGKLRYNYRNEKRGTKSWVVRDEKDWIVIDGHHPAIVSEEDWIGACQQLEANQLGTRKLSYNRKHVHIFSGLMTCGYCGENMGATLDRPRRDGWRPSVYNCYKHRRYNDCPNKYASDVIVGPFILNYIANLIRAQKSFGKSTSIETFQKKLLRGKFFADVECIERVGLQEMYDLIKSRSGGDTPFTLRERAGGGNDQTEERALLMSEKRRHERALKRLTSAYLYADNEIPEHEYITQRKSLLDQLADVDARIAELDKSISNAFNISDDEFMELASYFVMTQRLTDKRFVDYQSFIKEADPKIVRDFVTSVISNFCVKDCKILSITFRNGIEHRFVYKQPEQQDGPES